MEASDGGGPSLASRQEIATVQRSSSQRPLPDLEKAARRREEKRQRMTDS